MERDLGDLPPPASSKWQNNLRTMLEHWAANDGRVDPALDSSRMGCMYVSRETVAAVEAEMKRLTRETGKKWSAAAVVRLVWEQERAKGHEWVPSVEPAAARAL